MQTRKRALTTVLAAGLLVLPAGCGGSGADKAGTSDVPRTLRLAAADDAQQPDARFVRYFASRVSALSSGSLRVRIRWDAATQSVSDHEPRIARMVRDGDFDLGWIGARAWDQVGVTSFQALQAPFLVTDVALLGRIATGPLAARMLSGLDEFGVTGLALVPDRLRHAFGARRVFDSPEDFKGARLKVTPSRATDSLFRSLGAEPVHMSGDDVAKAVARGELDGAEAAFGTNSADEGETFVAADVSLFGKALTLFANEQAVTRLSDEQRDAVRQAAQDTARFASAHPLTEATLLQRFCDSGRAVTAVNAGADAVARLRQAAQPARAELERDPTTRALIREIEELKAIAGTTAQAPMSGCESTKKAPEGKTIPASTLNGTYHWRVTAAGAVAAGGSADSEDVGTIGKMTLRDGRWLMGDVEPEKYSGTYEIREDRLSFDWAGTTNTFRFRREPDGDLHLKPVPPMDLGDAVVMAGGTWRRVGPPVRDIP